MDERNVLIILNLSGNIDPVEKYISKRRKIYETQICHSFVCHAAHAGDLRLRRRGAFGYVFRFGFNGQHRKQIEQTGTVILTEMFLKKNAPQST